MIRAIRDYQDRTASRSATSPPAASPRPRTRCCYTFSLIKDELGDDWLSPHLFRFGASSLLGDIERQLEHHLTGHYSAFTGMRWDEPASLQTEGRCPSPLQGSPRDISRQKMTKGISVIFCLQYPRRRRTARLEIPLKTGCEGPST